MYAAEHRGGFTPGATMASQLPSWLSGMLGYGEEEMQRANRELVRSRQRRGLSTAGLDTEGTRPMFSRQAQIGESAEDIYNRAMMTVGNMTPDQQRQEAEEYRAFIQAIGGLRDEVTGLRDDIRAANPARSV
jgi:hypothetical protein